MFSAKATEPRTCKRAEHFIYPVLMANAELFLVIYSLLRQFPLLPL